MRVRLPVTDLVSRGVRQTLNEIAERAPRSIRPEDRPLVVLEFDTASGRSGLGSELEACQALARDLIDARLNRIETIAYIPQARSLVLEPDPDAPNSKGNLMGHAVLIAIASNRIAMEPGTMIGKAGVDENRVNRLVSTVYETIAEDRLTLPPPIVMAMLQSNREVLRVDRPSQRAAYMSQMELDEIQKTEVIDEIATISKAGEPLMMSAEELVKEKLISLVPESKDDLARELGVNIESLDADLLDTENRKAIQIPMPFRVNERATTWMIENINQRVADGVNVVILTFDDNRGDPDACIALAQHLAELKEREVKTVAFVREKATGPIGLIALACDNLIMKEDARIGGLTADSNDQLEAEEVQRLQPLIQNVANAAGKDWSMMLAMINPNIGVTSFRDTQNRSAPHRLLSDEELKTLKSPERWTPIRPLSMTDGLDATTSEQLGLARLIAEDIGQVEVFYHLDSSPEVIELRASERMLDRFAQFLRQPLVSMLLLMATFILFSNEMSAPGLGVPGFMALICITLYFWAMSLGGNAAWFEILMFIVGAGCIAIEFFVIPGFGIFGIGGILLVGLSLILSAQSFFIPSSIREFKQLPYSMLPVVGAGMGVVVGAWIMSRTLPNSKYFRKFMINPPQRDETGLEADRDPEAIVDWSFLENSKGETVTRLNPAGKAKIKGKIYDVISTGQLIDKGERILVVEAVGNRIVVQAENAS
ncbi:MAG: NfeD family protein [Planctomycetota bacterium]